MRRWTILLIPHDTDEPRTFAVSARALRVAAVGMLVVGASALLGVMSVAQRLAARHDAARTRRAMAGVPVPIDSPSSAVDSLRATVEALYGALDTIRQVDRRLNEVAGLAPSESAAIETQAALAGTRATADSLLRGATLVAGQLGALADSARTRRAVRGASGRGSQAPSSRGDEKK